MLTAATTTQIDAGRLYWYDGSAAAMSADSFNIYKNPYGPTSASLLASSVTRSSAACTAVPGDLIAAQCSYALTNNAGLSSGYSYYSSVKARNCMAGSSAVSSSVTDTYDYYTAARRRRLQHSSDVSSDVAAHVAGHLSNACSAGTDYAAAVAVHTDIDSSSSSTTSSASSSTTSSASSSTGRTGTGRKLQKAENATLSNSTDPVGLPPAGWAVPRVLSACEKAGGDTARLSDGTCDRWMNTKACKYDGECCLLYLSLLLWSLFVVAMVAVATVGTVRCSSSYADSSCHSSAMTAKLRCTAAALTVLVVAAPLLLCTSYCTLLHYVTVTVTSHVSVALCSHRR
jgi:hypothetical protein